MLRRTITDLSESTAESEEEVQSTKRGAKRKASGAQRFDLDDPVGLQVLLSKPCATQGCTKRCKDHFLKGSRFGSLLDFHKKWKAYHKLDRDQMVT